MARKNVLLGDFLVELGLISDDQLRQALKYHHDKGVKLGRSLIELGYITETEMIKALSEQLGVQYIKLKTYSIDPEVLKLIPAEMAWNFHVIPLFKIRERLTIAMVNPLDVFAIDALTRKTKLKIEPVVCFESEIHEALQTYYHLPSKHQDNQPESVQENHSSKTTHYQEIFLQVLEDFLDRLAQKRARQAFVSGNKIRVDFGPTYEEWPLPDRMDKKTFIRMLCNLGEEAVPHERFPYRFVIDKKVNEAPVRYHIITGSGLSSETATVVVQMHRNGKDGFLNEQSELSILAGELLQTKGIILLCAAKLYMLDEVYYPLWQSVSGQANYPISIENQPTVLLPETTQLTSTYPSEQLAMLRYAQTINCEVVFLKNIVDTAVLYHALSLAEMGISVVVGVASRMPWNVHTVIHNHENLLNFSRGLRKIYIYHSFPLLCTDCRNAIDAPEDIHTILGSKVQFPLYQPVGCEKCGRTGYSGSYNLELLWQNAREAESQNSEVWGMKLGKKLRRDLQRKILPLFEKGEVAIKMAYELFSE